jgi:hypothetical protein
MANNSSCWYCPKCKEELDGCHVTYQELCEYCGTAVLSVPESISQETIEEIIKAKADGRLMVLPCKVGDTVYRPDGIYPWYIEHIEIYGDEIIFVDDSDNIFRLDDIGKTVFLTREEAEKALEGSK